jgi:TRAP-type C4-dicarboxylate transport system substrate-binding protein
MPPTLRSFALSLAAAAVGLAVIAAVDARTPQPGDPIVIKVGTLAPEGTPWYEVIQEVGAKWKKASGGRISFTIFPGGVQGDEPDMIRKMRYNQLQMGAFTTVGLETITPEMSALWIPLLFQNYEELDYVRGKLDARLEKALGDKGFVVLNWGDAGWVKYFAKKPVPTLKALQDQKLFTWGGDARSTEMYKDAGFKIVPLSPTEILTSLQTGMIEAFPAPATAALANQWFGLAKHMADIKFAPVVGGTIITKAAWDKIDPALRPTLMTLARETGAKFTPQIRKLETDAIGAMVKRGLQVYKPTPQGEQEWQQLAEKFYPKIRGSLVPADLFDEVRRLVAEYRAQKPAAPATPAAPAKPAAPVKKEPAKPAAPVKK